MDFEWLTDSDIGNQLFDWPINKPLSELCFSIFSARGKWPEGAQSSPCDTCCAAYDARSWNVWFRCPVGQIYRRNGCPGTFNWRSDTKPRRKSVDGLLYWQTANSERSRNKLVIIIILNWKRFPFTVSVKPSKTPDEKFVVRSVKRSNYPNTSTGKLTVMYSDICPWT